MKKLSIMIAVMFAFTMMATNVMGQATTDEGQDEGQIEVNVTVEPFIEVDVIDPSINRDVNGTLFHDWAESSGNFQPNSDNTCDFTVRSNGSYSISVEGRDGLYQYNNGFYNIKFVSPTEETTHIGGAFSLTRDPDFAGGFIGDAMDFTTGELVTDSYAPEVHTWGLAFTVNAGDYVEQGTNMTGEKVAPAGQYTAVAVVTASLDD